MGKILEQTTRKQMLDDDNNVVTETIEVNTVSLTSTTEEGYYIKLYQAGIDKMIALPEVAIRLWLELANKASYANVANTQDYGGQLITVRSDMRKNICAKLGIADSTYYNNIKRLVDENCMRKILPGTYQINPAMIGKGTYNYSGKYDFGGIGMLRKCYEGNRLMQASVVSRDIDTIAILEQEITNLYAQLYKKCDSKERARIEKDIAILKKGRKQCSEEAYIMEVSYLKYLLKEV